MRVTKFTSEENAEERERIKADFAEGTHLQALVAIRCLDEGVNIPSIRTAFIMASSTNPKEYADAFANERENCIFLYRMVMLLDKTIELSPEERVDRAFRYDTLPEKVEEFRKNLELFHDYVRGGIEVMYEQFTDGCQTQDDYLSKTYEVMTTFKKELEGVSYADEIAHLIK